MTGEADFDWVEAEEKLGVRSYVEEADYFVVKLPIFLCHSAG